MLEIETRLCSAGFEFLMRGSARPAQCSAVKSNLNDKTQGVNTSMEPIISPENKKCIKKALTLQIVQYPTVKSEKAQKGSVVPVTAVTVPYRTIFS